MNSKPVDMLIQFLTTPPAPRPGRETTLQLTVEQAANVADIVASLKTDNARLTERNRNQRLELRRLNAAHLVKNARVHNLEKALATEQIDTVALTSTIRAFLEGEIVVIKPFEQVPMPAGGGPDLMSLVRDLTPTPGNFKG